MFYYVNPKYKKTKITTIVTNIFASLLILFEFKKACNHSQLTVMRNYRQVVILYYNFC